MFTRRALSAIVSAGLVVGVAGCSSGSAQSALKTDTELCAGQNYDLGLSAVRAAVGADPALYPELADVAQVHDLLIIRDVGLVVVAACNASTLLGFVALNAGGLGVNYFKTRAAWCAAARSSNETTKERDAGICG